MKLSAFQCLHKVQTSWLISGQWTKLKFRMTSWILRSTWGGRGIVPSCTTFEFILYFGCSSWSIFPFCCLQTYLFVASFPSLFVFHPLGRPSLWHSATKAWHSSYLTTGTEINLVFRIEINHIIFPMFLYPPFRMNITLLYKIKINHIFCPISLYLRSTS